MTPIDLQDGQSGDLLSRIRDVNSRIQSFNARQAVQEERYARYLSDLAEMGLTPETLPIEISRLEDEIRREEERLDKIISQIEQDLT